MSDDRPRRRFPMRTRDLAEEMWAAHAALTEPDRRELEQYGVPTSAIDRFKLVGIARINRIPDTDCYEPDPAGVWAYLTPVLVDDPISPESRWPDHYARGRIVDIVAWDPRRPRQWALRAGLATWLGCVPPQYVDPEPVYVWRSALNWLRGGCRGVTVLSRDPAVAYSLLMGFHGGIYAEDDAHVAELERILSRPWPVPRVSIGPPIAGKVPCAAE
jgi:hypothetical protein